MGLFEDWRGTIMLPPLPELRQKAGRFTVRQVVFRGATTRARIYPSQVTMHDVIRTELNPPYDELLLRHKGAKRRSSSLPVVTSLEKFDRVNPPASLTLHWDQADILFDRVNTPGKLLDTWAHQFSFRLEGDNDEPGLRLPQIGALHAIAAHFAVGEKFEPATVVLPTGTGKTETMLAAQVYLRPERTLVLVSGVPLRDQIEDKFLSLGYLPRTLAIPPELAGPRVVVISGGIRSAAEAGALLEQANVFIALPNSLDASHPEAIAALALGCSHLFVDEAHHITANTWRSVRDRFDTKRVIQFTATPFRRDEKRVDGKIIFNYKLGDAQRAGYYKKIRLRTVEEYGAQGARDLAVASSAVAALRSDLESNRDHILLARTEIQARADALASVYEHIASDLYPVKVYSDRPDSQNRVALEALRNRRATGSRIVICVNMLGEGFDFPQLKVAALHDTHKSLAITLQFVGRFTRKGPTDVGDATVITNIADPQAERKLAGLYAEGADWDQLIRRLSEERIADELQLQEVIERLKRSGNLAAQLSLWNLRPAISAQFYKTQCQDWAPLEYAKVLPRDAETWYALDEQDKLLVAVVAHAEEVKWGDYQNITNNLYDLVIARWDTDRRVLSLYASDYTRMRTEQIAKAIAGEEAELFGGDAIFNILNGVELPLVKNLGSRRVGAISFTTYFGANVTEGLSHIDKSEAELNNIACVGYEDGERVLWGGAKRKGKIWQQRKSGSIADWAEWTRSTWDKVTSDDDDVTNIIKGFLRPQKLVAPHPAHAISAEWSEQAQLSLAERQLVLFDTVEKQLFEVDVGIESVDDDGTVCVGFEADGFKSVYGLAISPAFTGGYAYQHKSGPRVSFQRVAKVAEPLDQYLQRDPVIIRYADGTHSYNCYHIPTKLQAGLYPRDQLEVWDFSGIPLNSESMGKTGDTRTIQYRAFERVHDEYSLILNDDGPGEAGDLVCFKDVDENTIKLTLVHCKGAIGARVSGLIENFYVVCGQAQKCISTKHKGIAKLIGVLQRRERLWAVNGSTRFLKGGNREMAYFREKARKSKVEFEVILVQPGANAEIVSDDILRLIATTELFLKKTTEATFRVIVNAAQP
ncbi:DEAD/DEAH box helicase [Bradyrhizobium arachidis]|uniref:DEAD/DEAH box helicase n=1 Tax=Bradyrhizobium arachidis TaxID=858423 RepID=UPI002162B0CA|nr:DEAD/DEAH box helicase family protein [Bradyrhizobium arachidis]UVO30396.1 DEAD/DEAH box helicase family protein [Bradyrhizobium arachidis]